MTSISGKVKKINLDVMDYLEFKLNDTTTVVCSKIGKDLWEVRFRKNGFEFFCPVYGIELSCANCVYSMPEQKCKAENLTVTSSAVKKWLTNHELLISYSISKKVGNGD